MYQQNRAIILAAKDVPCADCGERFPPVCMDFDHQRDKVRRVSNLYGAKVGTLLAEIAKCEVVCANCHRLRTFKKRATA